MTRQYALKPIPCRPWLLNSLSLQLTESHYEAEYGGEFGDIPGIGVEEVRAMIEAGKPVQIIDARPKHFVSRTQDIMEGAVWRDPDRVQDWAGELSKSEPVVTFCVYGFHVGCKTAIALRDAGFDAKYMKGGHSAWRAIGGAIRPKGV